MGKSVDVIGCVTSSVGCVVVQQFDPPIDHAYQHPHHRMKMMLQCTIGTGLVAMGVTVTCIARQTVGAHEGGEGVRAAAHLSPEQTIPVRISQQSMAITKTATSATITTTKVVLLMLLTVLVTTTMPPYHLVDYCHDWP